MAQSPTIIRLSSGTLSAFDEYARKAEDQMAPSLDGRALFLWSDERTERTKQVRGGKVLAQLWSGERSVKVPDGLIHDWVGAVFVEDATLEQTLARVQDYDHHKLIYRPDVMDSRLLSHSGNDYKIFLRLLKRKIITVVLDTYHDVHYEAVEPGSWLCRSYTTRVCEVDDAGTPRERVSPPDVGYGFLWRLYSYWRFAERSGGIVIECRAMSLTRDIPFGLGFIIEPIIKSLPRESLIATLEATRASLSPRSLVKGQS